LCVYGQAAAAAGRRAARGSPLSSGASWRKAEAEAILGEAENGAAERQLRRVQRAHARAEAQVAAAQAAVAAAEAAAQSLRARFPGAVGELGGRRARPQAPATHRSSADAATPRSARPRSASSAAASPAGETTSQLHARVRSALLTNTEVRCASAFERTAQQPTLLTRLLRP
jgi:multidrug resistance efflux pump